jgi:hypothetical protein
VTTPDDSPTDCEILPDGSTIQTMTAGEAADLLASLRHGGFDDPHGITPEDLENARDAHSVGETSYLTTCVECGKQIDLLAMTYIAEEVGG